MGRAGVGCSWLSDESGSRVKNFAHWWVRSRLVAKTGRKRRQTGRRDRCKGEEDLDEVGDIFFSKEDGVEGSASVFCLWGPFRWVRPWTLGSHDSLPALLFLRASYTFRNAGEEPQDTGLSLLSLSLSLSIPKQYVSLRVPSSLP